VNSLKVCVISLVGDFEFPENKNEEFSKNVEQVVIRTFRGTNWKIDKVTILDK